MKKRDYLRKMIRSKPGCHGRKPTLGRKRPKLKTGPKR